MDVPLDTGRPFPDLIRYMGSSGTVGVALYTDRRNIIEDVTFLFYLEDLQHLFYDFYPAKTIFWDVDFAKKTVDDFLVKMNNLRAFL